MSPRKSKISPLVVVLCFAGGACILVVAAGIHAAVRFKDRTVARTNSYRITEAMDAFREHYKRFPEGSAEEAIKALRGLNSDGKVFLDLRSLIDQQLHDPWGEPYCLLRSEVGEKPIFYSKGPDRINDGYAPDSDDLGAEQPKQEAQQDAPSNGG
jgi:hypothetical protein